MKITRTLTVEHIDYLEQQRAKANEGCNICPCCGESRKHAISYDLGRYKEYGISSGLVCKTFCRGIFHPKYMRIDCYMCYTCGAKWESDPYEIE